MSGSLRLLWLFLKRDQASLLLLALLPLSIWLTFLQVGNLQYRTWDWSLGWSAIVMAFSVPIAAGIAAWNAGGEARAKLGELVEVSPRSLAGRRLPQVGSTTLAVAAAFAVFQVVNLVVGSRNDFWGAIPWAGIAVCIVAPTAAAAAGFGIGSLSSSRFVPPFVAMFAFMLVAFSIVAGVTESTLAYLSPLVAVSDAFYSGSLFFEARYDPAWPNVVWMLGCAGVVLMVPFLMRQRTLATIAITAVLALVAMVGAVATMDASRGLLQQGRPPWDYRTATSFEWRCVNGAIQLCMHPAAAPDLQDRDAAVLDQVLAPLAGAPGAPHRVQVADPAGGRVSEELVEVHHAMPGEGIASYAALGALQPVRTPGEDRGSSLYLTDAQISVYDGLMKRVPDAADRWLEIDILVNIGHPEFQTVRSDGHTIAGSEIDGLIAQLSAHGDRIAAMDLPTLQAWFHDNLIALQNGEITLDQLP